MLSCGQELNKHGGWREPTDFLLDSDLPLNAVHFSWGTRVCPEGSVLFQLSSMADSHPPLPTASLFLSPPSNRSGWVVILKLSLKDVYLAICRA